MAHNWRQKRRKKRQAMAWWEHTAVPSSIHLSSQMLRDMAKEDEDKKDCDDGHGRGRQRSPSKHD
ncbi:hypothetical protein E5D57_010401 [Metarhizium anisopliae]|nr:hypothetical protein E5D57_010401 [Metarhizium anisopliae]